MALRVAKEGGSRTFICGDVMGFLVLLCSDDDQLSFRTAIGAYGSCVCSFYQQLNFPLAEPW